MAKNDTSAARISEGGMTADEAAYFASGGNAELKPPEGDAGAGGPQPGSEPAGGAAAPAAQPQPQQQAPAQQTQPQAPQPAADEDDDPPPSDPNATIPYQKYARDKKRLREQLRERDDRLTQTGTQLSDLQQKWARLDERFKLFQEAAGPDPATTATASKPKPDRETDPFGYMAWLEERIESLAPQVEQVTTQANEQQAYTALTNTFRTDAREFGRASPDFLESAPGAQDGAYHFLMKSRDAELQAAGYTDPAQRMQIITLDERDIVARALHARQTNPQAPGPAAVLYGLAKARGWQGRAAAPPAPAPNGGAAPAANGNGAAAPAAPSITAQVEAIARNQAASRSLSNGGGAPVPQGIDLAKIASMTDAEYLEFKRGLTPAQQKEFAGMIGAPN